MTAIALRDMNLDCLRETVFDSRTNNAVQTTASWKCSEAQYERVDLQDFNFINIKIACNSEYSENYVNHPECE